MKGLAVRLVVLACVCALAVAFIGSGFASAGGHGNGAGSFGLADAVSVQVPQTEQAAPVEEDESTGSATEFSESFVLETTA